MPVGSLATAVVFDFPVLTRTINWLLDEIHAHRNPIEANRNRIETLLEGRRPH